MTWADADSDHARTATLEEDELSFNGDHENFQDEEANECAYQKIYDEVGTPKRISHGEES